MESHQLINQTSGIYQIRNLASGKVYIGSAVNLHRRRKDHFVALRAGKHHCSPLQHSWNKHGSDAFVFEVLCFVTRPSDLINEEQRHLDQSTPLYNICRTAYSHLGVKRTSETVARMRASFRNRKRPPPLTPEHRAKIASALRGRPKSSATIEKLRAANKFKVLSDEHKAAISLAMRGRGHPQSAATRDKIAKAHRGRKPTNETRVKMRLAKLGTKISSETRQRMRDAQLRRWKHINS